MLTPQRAFALLSRSLIARGLALPILGAIALAWPESWLRPSMWAVGILVFVSGLLDAAAAMRVRTSFRAWPLLFGHGIACVGLGALTFAFATTPASIMVPLGVLWLVAYGAVMALLAFAMWPARKTRLALVIISTAHFLGAALGAGLATLPAFTVVYLGAFYALAFGCLQLATAKWIQRVAAPRFEPTVQSIWLRAAAR